MHRWHSGTVHIGGDQHGLAYVRFLLIPVQLRAAQRCMYQRGFGFGFGKRFRQRNRDRNHGRSYGNSTSTHAFRPNRERYASLCSTDVDSDSCDWDWDWDNGGAESGHDSARRTYGPRRQIWRRSEGGTVTVTLTGSRTASGEWRVAGRARGDQGRLWASVSGWHWQAGGLVDAKWDRNRQESVDRRSLGV